MDSKNTDLQILKQFQGFQHTSLMLDELPESSISAFEEELITTPIPLVSFPFEEARAFRYVGKRAEVFFWHQLELSQRYQDILYSLQVINDTKTIGEFDFTCFDTLHEEMLHIELVNKIYLYDKNLSDDPDYCWIGPNRKDRFEDKMNKLKSKQFPLLYHPEAETLLHQVNINPWAVKQKLCFKAILFLPEGCDTGFYLTNLNAVAGYFYTLEEFLNKKWQHQSFDIVKKLNWFTDETQHNRWYSYTEILLQIESFMESKQSVMLFRKDTQGNIFKLFVVWWTH
mgnify:CR=1 FL=1